MVNKMPPWRCYSLCSYLDCQKSKKESIVEVKIEEGITGIGNGFFEGFTSLEEIEINEGNTNLSSEGCMIMNKGKTELNQYRDGIEFS